ncbi:tRNA (uracil-5-)-methyltransferase [Pseudolabrys sp. Root1462]|uniref:methylenetetrahydrofolate--tRNA-(uracil(54)- C(5))-methyltransferase (FADH(2)-oxidizing) TrmFO n=1 Tax=Pseudolabrys sp. Root1462 TaxID=1736466 RepID=UPI000702ACA4|nr:methylenetetrahydrofolate--tRNA-(uracil(54)-C(5))-methyltransferase (FADH(2)-oxidizing) TrmFO [Pseudolabrys sp. Root1462]KQZ02496.1 tRNA (uracil-5-)-methyltransferase [Pseudolabrys sp. Root1462]
MSNPTTPAKFQPIHIVGGGLAGSEAAWQLARAGIPVILHEMRPQRETPAHKTDGYAELVCSNSFRSDHKEHNAVGLLHEEMRRLGSLIMRAADGHQVPAGGALAVDRDGFSAAVTAALQAEPLITLERGEVAVPPADWDSVIIATGPLTSPDLAAAIAQRTGETQLAFFDAIAPIVHADSIDMEKAWFQSRYDKAGPGGSGADYINCPMSREQYDAFVEALIAGDKTSFKEWEANTPYFSGCLPIEVMAERGRETLRHGPMKPFGLTNPRSPDVKSYAVVQLRQDNKLGTLFNMVGFQTKLKHGEQVRIFRTIPGLENADFARLGGLHRNTFLNSPKLLDETLRLKAYPAWRFAGQITGCEGYVESAAVGLMAARFAAAERRGEMLEPPPPTTAHGALLAHITGGHIETIDAGTSSFQPMNINFGLFPPIADPVTYDKDGRKFGRGSAKNLARKGALSARALDDLARWIDGTRSEAAE